MPSMPTPKESVMNKSRWILVSALALAGTLGAGAAHAGHGPDVQWSVTIGAPVYARPAPVHVYPAPVYTQAYPHYRGSAPYHQSPGHHGYYREPTRWDRDGDGIPNRHDRLYNPRWDVDGDGVPNRRDRDRDGDGIPNWHDRHDGKVWRR
jgi:hypothetical protein